jgi:hypothetical protein
MSHPAEDRAFVDAGLKAPAVRFIDVETDRLGSDDDPRRDAVPGRRYSFGTPALRSPAK